MSHDKSSMQSMAMMAAMRAGLPPLLVLAIIDQESSWDTHACRYEPKFKYLSGDDLSPTEEAMQKFSWGLMQVMGGTARWLGCLEKYLSVLTDPAYGLLYGCKYLKYHMNKYNGNEFMAIAAYNAGSARTVETSGGVHVFENQEYVDSVMSYYRNYLRGGDF